MATKHVQVHGIPSKVSQLENDSNFTTEAQLEAVQEIAETAEQIAMGKASGYVFNTEADLEAWLENPDNVAMLNLGDNLYIKDVEVPDYWWDGTQKQPLETQKVNLTEYIKTTEANDLIDQKLGTKFPVMTQEDYEALETKDANTFYFIKES